MAGAMATTTITRGLPNRSNLELLVKTIRYPRGIDFHTIIVPPHRDLCPTHKADLSESILAFVLQQEYGIVDHLFRDTKVCTPLTLREATKASNDVTVAAGLDLTRIDAKSASLHETDSNIAWKFFLNDNRASSATRRRFYPDRTQFICCIGFYDHGGAEIFLLPSNMYEVKQNSTLTIPLMWEHSKYAPFHLTLNRTRFVSLE